MSPGQCSNPGWWMISSKIILPNILRIMGIIRIQQEIPFLTNHYTGMTFGILKTCFSTSQMVWGRAECFGSWPTIGTAHDPTWRSFPLRIPDHQVDGWVFLGKITSQPDDSFVVLKDWPCDYQYHDLPGSTMIFLNHGDVPGLVLLLESGRDGDGESFSNSPKWLHFSCGVFRTFQWKDVKGRVFSFSANSGLWVYESYCGWLRNPNHQFFSAVYPFIPLFVGIWPSFWWLHPWWRSKHGPFFGWVFTKHPRYETGL